MVDGSEDVFEGKRVLITGGGGYFGNELGNELKKQGAVVVLFDIAWPFDVSDKMKCVQGDIAKKEDLEKVFDGGHVDTVFHSASYGMSGREQLNKQKIEKVNILGTNQEGQSYIEQGLFVFTYGQGNSVVDFVHVNNLVEAHTLAGKALIVTYSIAGKHILSLMIHQSTTLSSSDLLLKALGIPFLSSNYQSLLFTSLGADAKRSLSHQSPGT